MRRYGNSPWYSQSTYSLNIIPEEYVPPVDYDIDFCDAIHDETTSGGGGESLDRRGWSGASTGGNRTTLTASVHNNLMNGRMSSSSHNLSTRLSGSSQNLHQLQPPTNAYGFPMVPPANNPSDSSASGRIASILARPFRTNPLKRTKSVSKMEKSLAEANQHAFHRRKQSKSRRNSIFSRIRLHHHSNPISFSPANNLKRNFLLFFSYESRN
ncbi:hypothetical protein GCK72_023307 [Caenorhabditis remanei]|uniref:Uncharacterized protein n=1 Tax=Caenorhabditis remanei TaxID=31234 RepID=A0A6A5FWS4_CAERE|nr:hypothetical protein GCK72_023307 [Caenorhabditis remanei]KAF1746849.1 hypothetical protein GCK72_023307 [Caenorhabditis remanei]